MLLFLLRHNSDGFRGHFKMLNFLTVTTKNSTQTRKQGRQKHLETTAARLSVFFFAVNGRHLLLHLSTIVVLRDLGFLQVLSDCGCRGFLLKLLKPEPTLLPNGLILTELRPLDFCPRLTATIPLALAAFSLYSPFKFRNF